MTDASLPLARTRFIVWRHVADPFANEIERDGVVERVEPKVMGLLVCLAERAGQVVTRDELIEAVWPNVVVTDNTLSRCVSQLRKALGDDARAPRVVETIPTVGYRLNAAVSPAPEPGRPPAPNETPDASAPRPSVELAGPDAVSPWGRPGRLVALGVLLVVLTVLAGRFLGSEGSAEAVAPPAPEATSPGNGEALAPTAPPREWGADPPAVAPRAPR